MLLKRFKKAVAKMTRPEEPERMVTDGFTDERFKGMITHFAQASRREDGTYYVSYSEKYSVSYHHKTGPRDLNLTEALQALDEWQRQWQEKKGTTRNNELGFEAANYRDIAKRFGVKLGVEGASLRQAARTKRLARLFRNKPHK